MKQSRVRFAAVLVATMLVAGPLAATPISDPDTPGDDDAPAVCVLTTHDLWVYKVSEMLRKAGLFKLRLMFVFATLEDGRYECTG